MGRKTLRGVRVPKSQGKGMTFTRHIAAEDNAATTEQDSVASTQIPSDAFLIGYVLSASMTFDATNQFGRVEVSTSGNYQGDTTDNGNTIATTMLRSFGTSMESSSSHAMSGMRIPFAAGERVHVNTAHTASKGLRFQVTLHFEQR